MKRSDLASKTNWMSVGLIVASICMTLQATKVVGANAFWVGPGGGDFQTPANWSIGGNPGVPTAADIAFMGTANGTVTYSADAATAATYFTGANATATLDIGPGRVHGATGLIIVGSGGANQDLVVPSGTVNGGSILIIGSGLGSDNSDVTVSGASTVFNSLGGVFIGTGGANPTLTVKQGAKFNAGGGLLGVGLQQTNNGLLTVTDPGSSAVTTGALQVGSNNDPGNANMTNNQAKILNGGSVSARVMQIGILVGVNQNATTVSGTNSKLTLTGEGSEAPIGWRSVGNSLTVDNGGLIDAGNRFTMGIEATSTGNSATIASGGRINATGFETRRGTLNITDGSIYLRQYLDRKDINDPNDDVYVGGSFVSNVGANGFVNFNSGTVQAISAAFNKTFTVGNGGANSATYRMVKGTLGLNGLHDFTAGGLVLASNGILEGNGDIAGNVSGAAGSSVNIGASPGLMNVTGNWDNTNMSLYLEIDNLLASSVAGVGFDQLNVSSAFTHGGAVTIDVSQFVYPLSGPSIKLIGWGSEVGSTSSTNVSFVGGPALGYSFQSDGLYVTVVPEPATIVLAVSLLGLGFIQRRRVDAIC